MVLAVGAGYEVQAWESFAVAEVGAAAALAGLLVVAASINIGRIIELPGIVARLGGTLALFTGVLVVGTEMLVPGLGRGVLGTLIAGTGAALAAIVIGFGGIRQTDPDYRRSMAVTMGVALVATLLIVGAGVSYAAGVGGGLYWLAPGVLVAFSIGLVNAWVALIEILR